MKIKIESHPFDEKCYCHLCGNIFFPVAVLARAYQESGDYLTDVCPECIATGPEGMRVRMRQRAESLRGIAHELDQLARRTIEAPSLAQLNIANQLEKALR